VKCILDFTVICPKYEPQKELRYKPNLQEIQDEECPHAHMDLTA
jgi:hypothetical protein